MGNEQSSQGSSRQAGKDILKQVDIDHPILTTSGWAFYHAQSLPSHESGHSLSLFISQNNVEDLKGIGKHLRSLRHPNVLRFIDGFQQDSSKPYVLVTERVSPLSHSLKQQAPLQIRLGLQKIVQALDFVVNVAKITGHVDIDKDSIFITAQGNWKLLVHETKQSDKTKKSFDSFIKDLFADQPDDAESWDFQSFIDNETEVNHEKILSHPFFSSNIFVEIENFLSHLAIKKEEDKSTFFASLTSKLQENIPEKLIAKQLTPLLLSRMVLLDPNANQYFLPHFLGAKPDDDDGDNSILSPSLFQEYVIPMLTNIFHVRDTQIRLVLLKFLPKYIQMFSTNQLEDLLPLILLGMRDSNDQVVSETLKAIALLVPILGATKVVGKNRRKIFTDGSPSKVKTKKDIRDDDHVTHRLQELRQSPIGAETSDEEKEPTEEWEPWQEDLEVEKITENHSIDNCEEPTGDNFFADMEPVIENTAKVCIQQDKFAIQIDWNDVDDEAWS